MSRKRHPKKEVEDALQDAEGHGWKVIVRTGGGHAWGLLRCPQKTDECRCGQYCQMSISSTPENPGSHAAKLTSKVLGCINLLNQTDEEG